MSDEIDYLLFASNNNKDLTIDYSDMPIKESFIKDKNIIPSDDEKEIKTYRYIPPVLNIEEERKAKIILLIGQTGNGKTTLINFLINILLGVKFEDNYRFKIAVEKKRLNESISNTLGVHPYNINIKGYPYPIKVIDCQGIGDTRGTYEDEQLISQLKELFNSIYYINCICFVVKESDIRLVSVQQYIYKLILDLFAKNVKKNFVLMITNSHFEENPQVIKTLNLEDSFFSSVIPHLEEPYYFQFENGSLYLNRKNKMDKMFFEESMENMNKFLIDKLIKLEPVPTHDCVEVCKERLLQKIIFQKIIKKRKLLIDKKKYLEKN